MSRSYYDPELSKTDPLEPRHYKLPRSLIQALNQEARRRDREAAYLVREILTEWEQRTREERKENEKANGAGSQPPKSRKRRG